VLFQLLVIAMAGCDTGSHPAPVWIFNIEYPDQVVPVVAGQHVFVASDKLYCLDAMTGTLAWTFQTYCYMPYPPVVSDGRVYVQSGGLYCLDEKSGTLLWEFWRDKWGDGRPVVGKDGRVYIVIENTVYSVDAVTGRMIGLLPICSAKPTPIGADGYLYMVCKENLFCVDTSNGEVLWQVDAGSMVMEVVIGQGRVYVGTVGNKVLCLDRPSGTNIWTYEAALPIASLAISDQHVYASSGTLLCLNTTTGQLVWEGKAGSPLFWPPLVMGAHVFVTSNDGKVHCFDAQTGERRAVYVLPLGGDINITNGYLYAAGARTQGVACYKLDSLKK
jgi:outer membrane protein assembly factor BamB